MSALEAMRELNARPTQDAVAKMALSAFRSGCKLRRIAVRRDVYFRLLIEAHNAPRLNECLALQMPWGSMRVDCRD